MKDTKNEKNAKLPSELSDNDTGSKHEDRAVGHGEPEGYSKYPYSAYQLMIDPEQGNKATEIKVCNFSRPHMRAFHCSWWGFFIAFFIWFSITPLLSEIRTSLDLTKEQIWTSNIFGVCGTMVMCFVLGPLCDKFGARVLFTAVLCFASIPTALTGAANSATGLAILRLFTGSAGGSFIMCQYWTTRMFTKEVVGTANALVGGWGSAGGGVSQLVMGSILFPLFKTIFGGNADKAWRTVCIVPSVAAFASGVIIYYISDGSPKGNYHELKKLGAMPIISATASFRSGFLNLNTWILFMQYACCFGVELTMNNASALYFKDQFGQSTESAAAIASIFGFMNLFALGLGGYLSDKCNAWCGMRGRIILQTFCLFVEGALVFIFANTKTLGMAIFIMLLLALFAQMTQGAIYGVVPYIDSSSTGSIAGIVGAGGNAGAVCFGLGFRQLGYKQAFVIMGIVILVSSVLSGFINIKGQSQLFGGKYTEDEEEAQTLKIPVPSKDDDDDDDDERG